ncbi:MAG: GNAT family N-acetyltransferase [Candidatus Thorarchaeota archaeon]|nr:GNAT family N-acetyltransferase [Candidatus Thorarchaeota archaeon]
MKVEEIRFEEADRQRIAKLILHARQAAGYWDSSMEISRVEEILSRDFEGLNVKLISIEEDGQIKGSILLKVNDDNTAEINPWFLGGLPIVSPSAKNGNELASTLLTKALQSAMRIGVTRVEALFPHDVHSEQIKTMFKAHDMELIEEIEHLRSPLTELVVSTPDIPIEGNVVRLSDIDRAQLFDCWYKTFTTGEDRSILSRNEKERRVFFEEGFDLTKEWVDKASLAIIAEKTLIAFALIRSTHGRENAHLWQFGVHPEHRRKGLAKGLLKRIFEKLIELGFTTLSLNVDVSNFPAYHLYKSLGLKREWGLVCYAWKERE